MTDFAIRVTDLSKLYRIGEHRAAYDTFRDELTRLGGFMRGRRRPVPRQTIWALSDVSFEIGQGEVVGIVGRNGAGKTTLLRILSRITEPTRGFADIRGRLGSLLEVGTGFHPELTGRENVFLNGAILGMRRNEIVRKLDEIFAFAGVEKFADTPVKRYSSGMHVRLAFAVAAHLEPEILLVDEVLAVGDAEFQKRCLGKLDDIARSGRTVLFVSHNMQTVSRLCARALLLDGGVLVDDGPTAEVIPKYLQSAVGAMSRIEWLDAERAPGDNIARLRSVRIVNARGETVDVSDVREPVGIEIGFAVLAVGPAIRPQIMLRNEQGEHAFNAMDTDERWRSPTPPGSYVATAWIPSNLLNEGLMTASVFLSTITPGSVFQHAAQMDVVSFQVVDPVEGDSAKGDWVGQWGGALRPKLQWTTGPAADSPVRHAERPARVRRVT